MIAALIGNLILGAIVGYGGRLALPGAQNISAVQTVGVGVAAAIIGYAIFSWFWVPITFVLTVLLAAAGIKIGMDKGFLKESV